MEMPYLIKKCGLYIGPKNYGYVDTPVLAKVFSEEFAKSLVKKDENLKAIPLNRVFVSTDLLILHIEQMQAMVDALKADNPTGE